MVGDAVTESLYLLKLIEHRPLSQSGSAIREYA